MSKKLIKTKKYENLTLFKTNRLSDSSLKKAGNMSKPALSLHAAKVNENIS